MYTYTYDPSTGGILLTSSYSDGKLSKEPRPVYAEELTLLGFNTFWKYEDQNDAPYMWAEANNYYYRGKKVATIKGGNFYEKPIIVLTKDDDGNVVQPEPNGKTLRKVDIRKMVEKNKVFLSILETATVKKIKDVYEKYQRKLDSFHVAYSGGKDSVVLLNLIRKTLPVRSYIVSFADTGMEVSDTYELINRTKEDLQKSDIPFFCSESHFNPLDSWKLFAPPSRVLRWCCSVHKSTPQALTLRRVTHKTDYHGLAFIGVRHSESVMRSSYEYESYGKKQQGQYSFAPILEWTSAEVWLYIYANDLLINKAYKKGCARVGCICCPMGGGRDHYVKQQIYSEQITPYLELIQESDSRSHLSTLTYLTNGGWNGRKSGSYIKGNLPVYTEKTLKGKIIIEVKAFKTPWKEWIKPLGDIIQDSDGTYTILYKNKHYKFRVDQQEPQENGYIISWDDSQIKEDREFSKLLRLVFRKATYCLSCRTCEVNCKFGCMTFENGLKITDCRHCLDCYQIPSGCIAYNSLKIPGKVDTRMAVLNTLDTHAPKNEWFRDFFNKENFLESNTLGSKQIYNFKKFLKFADVLDSKTRTKLAYLGNEIGWDTPAYLGLLLVNLAANNQQFRWYIKSMVMDHEYASSEIMDKLINEGGQSQDNAKRIISAFTRFSENVFGTELHWCAVYKEGKDSFYTRTKCVMTDYRVFLYGLYKFAELNDDLKHFTLDTLMDESADRKGLSPTQIFGIDAEEAELILKGLSARYEDFINASFTHDLQKIDLREDKTSADVLSLF